MGWLLSLADLDLALMYLMVSVLLGLVGWCLVDFYLIEWFLVDLSHMVPCLLAMYPVGWRLSSIALVLVPKYLFVSCLGCWDLGAIFLTVLCLSNWGLVAMYIIVLHQGS